MNAETLVPPRDLFGADRPDRLYHALTKVVGAFERLSANSAAGRRPVPEVDRNLRLVVSEVVPEADEVVSLRLTAVDGDALPPWEPGCHLDLLLPSGKRRQYSLCGDPADRWSYRIAVRRIADGGGGSREVHDELAVGSTITAQGPRNAFPFVRQQRYLFLAGGIGITPILPMVRAAARAGADWRFVYTGRSRASMPFLAELGELAERFPDRIEIRPDDEHGVPGRAELLARTPEGAAVYCCGPIPMIDEVRRGFDDSGARSLHYERFSPPPVVDGRPFEVLLRRTGRTVEVPADRSALETIRAVLPDVAYSCQQGFCGTCKVRVLAGAVEHRDRRLTEEERAEQMMICVSRAAGDRVELDL